MHDGGDMTDSSGLEERMALVVARFAPMQRIEYQQYGLAAIEAALALDEGYFALASSRFVALFERAVEPVYLLRDLGRASAMLGDELVATAWFEKFLVVAEPDMPAEIRLETRVDLARFADRRGDIDGAIATLSDLVDELPDDSRAYLALGSYLRQRGFAVEALEVHEAASAGDGGAISSAVLEEIGLCHLALGRLAEAERALAEVVRRARCACGARVPRETAEALATVYERTARVQEAESLRRSVGIAPCASHT